jgi:hypothetical protein
MGLESLSSLLHHHLWADNHMCSVDLDSIPGVSAKFQPLHSHWTFFARHEHDPPFPCLDVCVLPRSCLATLLAEDPSAAQVTQHQKTQIAVDAPKGRCIGAHLAEPQQTELSFLSGAVLQWEPEGGACLALSQGAAEQRQVYDSGTLFIILNKSCSVRSHGHAPEGGSSESVPVYNTPYTFSSCSLYALASELLHIRHLAQA